jgi:PAS domain S-box-containing protein
METGLQFEAVADSLGDIVLLLTLEGEIAWANEAAALATGRTRQGLLGAALVNLLTPASAEVTERALQLMRRDEACTAAYELEFISVNLMSSRSEVRFSLLPGPLRQIAAVGRSAAARNVVEGYRRRAQFQTFQFQEALVELAKSESESLTARLKHLTGVAATTLDVARVGVWLYNNAHSEIRCVHLFDREKNEHGAGAILTVNRYPRHFEALEQARTIAAEDARTDPLTAELAADYLVHTNTQSILDVPIRWDGETVGVLCHEHAGERRHWGMDERNFAASLADLTALALETERRRRAESELQESLGQLELFFSQSLDGFFFMMFDEPIQWHEGVDKEQVMEYVFDHQRIVKANEAVLSQYGVSREAFLGSTPRQLFAHDPEHGKHLWRQMLDAGRLHVESDERKFDGSRMWVEGDYICFYDRYGRITGHFGIQRDITERKLAEQALRDLNERINQHAAELEDRVVERTAQLSNMNAKLRDSEERLAGIFQSAMDAIVVVDRQRTVVMLNGAAEKIFRCRQEQAVGKPVDTWLTDDLLHVFQNYVEDDREAPLWVAAGHHAKRFDGEVFPVEASVSRARVSNGLLFSIVLRDVNEKKHAEERLEQLLRQNIYLQEEFRHEFNFEEIVGASRAMQDVFRSIEMVAETDSTVLLLGETGTGKELIARAVHNRSRRRQNAMVKVNCGALPSNLVESELFGHERGAFTGAISQKKGRFELANRGTIFLDEVGELPPDTQIKLLRVLQEQEFERVGGSQSIRVDVRVIAATNRDLAEEIKRGTFRMDLYYRLNVFPIFVPPLRQRREDIPLLTAYFVRKFAERMRKQIDGVSPEVSTRLERYDWPGNVRELANLIERAVILCQGSTLRGSHIALTQETAKPRESRVTLPTLEEGERNLIVEALKRTNGVLAGPDGAAHLLGINRSTLWSRIRKLGIEVSKPKDGIPPSFL